MTPTMDEINKGIAQGRRWKRVQRIGMTLFVLAVIAGFITLGVRDHSRGEALTQVGQALNTQRAQTYACGKLKAPKRVKACTSPVVPNAKTIIEKVGNTGTVGPIGPRGPVGPSPSAAQIQNAVDVYCMNNACKGNSVSSAQVFAAVATYCTANGQCRGPQGKPGDTATGAAGKDGSDGTNGRDGSPPSADQIADAVTNYCSSHSNCQGDKGEKGDTGETGVVKAVTDPSCDPQDGMFIASSNLDYDADSRTVTLTCSQRSVLVGN